MFWSQYKGRSFGRLLNYIDKYCGLYLAERVCYGSTNDEWPITFNGKPFAKVTYDENEVPNFVFALEYEQYEKRQELLKDEMVMTEKARSGEISWFDLDTFLREKYAMTGDK